MEAAEVVTVRQMSNLKPLQLRHTGNFNNNLNQNDKTRTSDENYLKTHNIQNNVMSDSSNKLGCRDAKRKKNNNQTLTWSRKTQEVNEDNTKEVNLKQQKARGAEKLETSGTEELETMGTEELETMGAEELETMVVEELETRGAEELETLMGAEELETRGAEELETVSKVNAERVEDVDCIRRERKGAKDIVILNSEDEAVLKLRQQMLALDVPELTVDVFDNIHLGKTEMEAIRLVSQQYNTVFLYRTESFNKDKLRRFQSEVLQREALETKQKVVPIFVGNVKPCITDNKGIRLQETKSMLLIQIKDLIIDGRKESLF